MSTLDDLLKSIPVGDIATKLGIDENLANLAVQTAVPALLGGMTHNAQSEDGAAALESALEKHQVPDVGSLSLDAVDTADGEKIVGHVFGDKKDDVVSALGAQAAPLAGILPKVLPMLAPIVMAFLANKAFSGKKAEPAQQQASGGGLGDMLGGLLGGGQQQGGGLGDIIGGLIGGGKSQQQQGGGLGGLLGGLLGGNK
ncbi:DUF937 domain-containing protein [Leucobacter sp. M11]|uniref:DUF937 domain-containing protein n=1 Tax=Leucobacter sp. M11 TaxID=2993565 RepID=UPI002D806659|nr:DUF937 domain-containing protein [Leucobacter sp. M11]MEB4615171.1 DUF937 domain-containing protein [Leucobacter sp. M11]